MDQWWLQIARELPGLGVLVWLVTYFLKHLRGLSDDNHRQYREGMEVFSTMCRSHQERVVKAIEKNSDCLDRINAQLHKLNGD